MKNQPSFKSANDLVELDNNELKKWYKLTMNTSLVKSYMSQGTQTIVIIHFYFCSHYLLIGGSNFSHRQTAKSIVL